MVAETTKEKVQRFCNWCDAMWWEFLTRIQLRKIMNREVISECPECKKMT